MTDARAVVLHPHPAMGGDSSHPLVQSIARRLREAGFEVDTPDISDPDVGAAAALVSAIEADVLIGYSWGSVVVSHARPVGLVTRVLIAPPASMPLGDLPDGVTQLMLVPEHDQFGGPDAFAGASYELIPGEDHFLWGSIEKVAQLAGDFAEGALGTVG